MRVGLVLGGGGAVGMAYHAGALAALHQDLGWDPRTADVIVGTSAGSVVGGLLRKGVPALDLAALAVGADPRETDAGIARSVRARADFPPLRIRTFARRPRLPNLALVMSWARQPWRLDPVGVVTSLIPDGSVDLLEHVRATGTAWDGWPEDDLVVCAVRQRDLRLATLTRDAGVPLADAIAASCAVPGYFAPVRIGGHPYVDGGVRSPTNADVLRGRSLDLVVVIAPTAGRAPRWLGSERAVREHSRRKVAVERRRLKAAGIPTVVIEPGVEVIRTLGLDFMDASRVVDITRGAFLDTGRQLLDEPALRPLAALRSRPPHAGRGAA